MSDESVNNVEEGPEEIVTAEAPPEDSDAEVSARPVSEEELVKETKDKDVARIVAELLRGQQIASVYIDARSGGVFFGGKARITGDIVGGDQAKWVPAAATDALAEAPAGRVLSENLAKVGGVYVRPSIYSHAQRILSERHVLILWGQAHWGKWTTALHLLSTLHADEIFEINPDVNLDGILSSEFELQRGYVIDTLAPEGVEKLNTFVLNRMSNRLRKRHSHLVITVDSRVPLSKETLSGYLVVWSDVPDRAQLLEKHLACYLTDKDMLARARELSQADAVQQLLSTHLLPGEIDHLAELLAGVARGELKLEEALARARQQTHFHGPVTGQVHTGSGDISIDYISGKAVAVGVEKDSGNVIVVEPESSTVIGGVPKQAAYERIAAAANATRQQLTQIYEQSRQQATDWTRFSLGAAVLGFLIVLGGIVTMLLGNTTVGLVTTAASLIPEVAAGLFFQQARGANRRVDENQERLLGAEGIHQIIELVITIDDEGTRDRLKGTIILNALGLSGAGEILTTPASESDG